MAVSGGAQRRSSPVNLDPELLGMVCDAVWTGMKLETRASGTTKARR
jgi:hypothetical protein